MKEKDEFEDEIDSSKPTNITDLLEPLVDGNIIH